MHLNQLNFHHLFYFWRVAKLGHLTRAALEDRGCAVADLPVLTDVDTPEDARAVAATMPPASRFRRALEALDPAGAGPGSPV